MKAIIYIVSLFLFVSCNNKQKDVKIEAENETFNLNKKIWEKSDWESFFLTNIENYELKDVSFIKSQNIAIATYLKEKDFNNSLNITIEDGKLKNNTVTYTFNSEYNSKSIPPQYTSYEKKERDGFKTIAFLQPNIKRNSVKFIYNNRYKITIEGVEHPDKLWSYLYFNNLKVLNNN